jgi:serpin B
MRLKSIVLIALSLVLVLAACAPAVSASEVRSNQPRATGVVLPTGDLKALVEGDTTFALDLYQQLKKESSRNFFYSPYSLSLALAMAYGGARNETEKQMAAALHYTLPQDRLHAAFNSLDQALRQRGQGARGRDEKGFRLNIANATWGQKDFPFLASYLDLLAANYGAGLRLLDFRAAPEPSRITINDWVSDRTEFRIKDLIPKGAITTDSRLVLTNAVYFNAAWLYPFEKAATTPGPFNLLDYNKVNVPMMKQTKSFNYYKGTGFEAVELPYDGRELSMVILLPALDPAMSSLKLDQQFAAFEGKLDAATVAGAISGLKSTQVALAMPKFKVESSFSLNKALAALGMGQAFTDTADFSGIDGKKDLSISAVVHKSFVETDEAGTEAAAASGVIVGTTSMPAQPVSVTVDRPFVFLIRDIQTGAVLFVGRMVNPA